MLWKGSCKKRFFSTKVSTSKLEISKISPYNLEMSIKEFECSSNIKCPSCSVSPRAYSRIPDLCADLKRIIISLVMGFVFIVGLYIMYASFENCRP